jgi:hypothetical protein
VQNQAQQANQQSVKFENNQTRIVHKGFPGNSTGVVAPFGKRTNFDLAVLEVDNACSLVPYDGMLPDANTFIQGNFKVDFGLELSLNYDIEHLCWDMYKFLTQVNKCNHLYIIHLYNKQHNINSTNSKFNQTITLINDILAKRNLPNMPDMPDIQQTIIENVARHRNVDINGLPNLNVNMQLLQNITFVFAYPLDTGKFQNIFFFNTPI